MAVVRCLTVGPNADGAVLTPLGPHVLESYRHTVLRAIVATKPDGVNSLCLRRAAATRNRTQEVQSCCRSCA